MKDVKLYLEKLRTDAEDCLTISETAASDTKREVFKILSATYQRLADDLAEIIALNLIADDQREKRLIGLLSGDDGTDHLAELAKLLGHEARTV